MYDFYYRDSNYERRQPPDRAFYVSSVTKVQEGQAAQRNYIRDDIVDYVQSNRTPMAPPHKIMLCVSDQCNFMCNMCTYRPGLQKPLMTLEDWKRLVDETLFADVAYTFFGGEPLLYPDIEKLVCYMGEKEARMNIVTNGFYLERYLEVLLENQCQIIISLDGLGDTHDMIRGRSGSFAKIEKALSVIFSRFPEEKQKLLSINCVLLPENMEHVGELIDYLYGIGVANLCFQHLQFYGKEEQQATDILWKQYLRQPFDCRLIPRKTYTFDETTVQKLQNAVNIIQQARINYPDMGIWIFPELSVDEIALYYSKEHEKLSYKSLCLTPWTNAMVGADGSISICLDSCIGNIREQNFWSAWYGEEAKRLRSFVQEQVFPVCTRCCNFYNSYIPQ